MEQARIKDDEYVSSNSPDGGTSRTSVNVVWWRWPVGGTGAKSVDSDCVNNSDKFSSF